MNRTPWRGGYRPVRMVEKEDHVRGLETFVSSNRTVSRASWSRFGDVGRGPP
jgi:hypothetical protein